MKRVKTNQMYTTLDDLQICKLVSRGHTIPSVVQLMGYDNTNVVDNRLKVMRKRYQASNTVHLIYILLKNKLID